MSPLRESEEFRRGRVGEWIVSMIMRAKKYHVVPSYDYAGVDGGKPPRMQGANLALIIPDLDVCRGGRRSWFEVKTKSRADYTRVTGRDEHGMDLWHFNQYQQVELESGCDVTVAVYEETTGDVLAIGLKTIARIGRKSPNFNNGRGGMFWPRDDMAPLATVEKAGDVYTIAVLTRLPVDPREPPIVSLTSVFEGQRFTVNAARLPDVAPRGGDLFGVVAR